MKAKKVKQRLAGRISDYERMVASDSQKATQYTKPGSFKKKR